MPTPKCVTMHKPDILVVIFGLNIEYIYRLKVGNTTRDTLAPGMVEDLDIEVGRGGTLLRDSHGAQVPSTRHLLRHYLPQQHPVAEDIHLSRPAHILDYAYKRDSSLGQEGLRLHERRNSRLYGILKMK